MLENCTLMCLIIEFLGTFVFLSVILGTGMALPIGLTLSAVIWFGGKFSGGHFNPAVSFMMYLNKKIPFEKMILYIIVQLLGGAGACFYITTAERERKVKHYLKE